MQIFFESIGFGLVTASVIAIAAVGLTVQFGITNFINFAYGDYLTFGAYMGYLANGPLHQNIIVSLIAAAIATGLFALLVNEFVFQPFLRDKPRLVIMLIVTVGISLIMENTLQIIFGPGFYTYTGLPSATLNNVGPFIFSGTQLVVMAVAVVALVGVHLLLQFTKLGTAMRAMSDSESLSRASGINVTQVTRATWILSGVLAGIGGVVLTLNLNTIQPTSGVLFVFVVFAAVIMGGIGRPFGAMFAALVIGVVTEVSGSYIDAAYKQAIAFGILVLVLIVRPNGLFAARGRH